MSTFTTVAPLSARTIPQKGPGAKPANSITFMPFSAIVLQRSL